MNAPAPSPAQDRPSADFRHVRDWIFDLDNTLYRADNGIFAQIESRMTDFVMRVTALPRDEARLLQKSLYREHGTTMCGLMKLHGVDPDEYMDYVHDIDLSSLAADPGLIAGLQRLPGRRFIFTNGCRRHAARILYRIGLDPALFDDLWDIRSMGFQPKPDIAAYDMVVRACGLVPGNAAMFDDLAHNLLAARRLGMTTVWLNTGARWSREGKGSDTAANTHIDHETDDLPAFLHSIRI